jgi:formylglycine-generating enzyme required for sulfatase activity
MQNLYRFIFPNTSLVTKALTKIVFLNWNEFCIGLLTAPCYLNNEASRSKSPTRQSRYGDGALQGILAKANKSAQYKPKRADSNVYFQGIRMAVSITLSGIDQAISNLDYKNLSSLKSRMISFIRGQYPADRPIDSITPMPTDELVKALWDTGIDHRASRTKRKNLHTVKSSINADLKVLYNEGKNPEGIAIGPDNTFVMSDEAKDKFLKEFGYEASSDGSLSPRGILSLLQKLNETVSNPEHVETMEQTENETVLEEIKNLITEISESIKTPDLNAAAQTTGNLFDSKQQEPVNLSPGPGVPDGNAADVMGPKEAGRADGPGALEVGPSTAHSEPETIDETDNIEKPDDPAIEALEVIEEPDDQSIEEVDVIDDSEETDVIDDVQDDEILDIADDIEETEVEDIDLIDDIVDEEAVEETDDMPQGGTQPGGEDLDASTMGGSKETENVPFGLDNDMPESNIAGGGMSPKETEPDDGSAALENGQPPEHSEPEPIDETDDIEEPDDQSLEEVDVIDDVEDEEDLEETDNIEETEVEDIDLIDDIDDEEVVEEIDGTEETEVEAGDDFNDEQAVEGSGALASSGSGEAIGLPVDSLGSENHDGLDESLEKRRLLAEEFDGYLGTIDRYYNHFILIPGQDYPIGGNTTAGVENPERVVRLSSFFMGRFPVTNALFEIFIDKTGYRTTAEKCGYGTVYRGRFQKAKDEKTGLLTSTWNASIITKPVEGACWYQPFGPGSTLHSKRNHPVVQVSLEDAAAFSAWTGKRLPTEEEWEAAARTARGYSLPWGDELREGACNLECSGICDTAPVDRFADFENEFGIVDVLGNVMEFTTNGSKIAKVDENGRKYVFGKGGCWIFGDEVRLSNRFRLDPESPSNILGFRCVAC